MCVVIVWNYRRPTTTCDKASPTSCTSQLCQTSPSIVQPILVVSYSGCGLIVKI